MLQNLCLLQHPPPLLGRHVIELIELVTKPLLGLGRQVAKTGLILERTLLLRRRKIAVTIHPLPQVILVLLLGRCRVRNRRMCYKTTPVSTPKLSRQPRLGRKQKQGRKGWLEQAPKFGLKSHDVQVVNDLHAFMSTMMLL